jgi:23S rRNA pseudouridine2457 synthase
MYRHFIVYKPYEMLSQLGTEGYKKKRGLSELFSFPEKVQPIGRLDEDSEGLLLMTSDTKLSALVRGAKIEKEYWVQLDGAITDEAIEQLQKGVTITVDKLPYTTLSCRAWRVEGEPDFGPRVPPTRAGHHRPASWLAIVLKEGKHRQVRKMTAAVGFPTLRLVRIRIGRMNLDGMKPGDVKEWKEFLL